MCVVAEGQYLRSPSAQRILGKYPPLLLRKAFLSWSIQVRPIGNDIANMHINTFRVLCSVKVNAGTKEIQKHMTKKHQFAISTMV